MCLLAIAWKTHPRYPLIFAGNRDEFHARPAEAAHWWQDAPNVLGGRDLEAGGTWLGVSREARFAVVTNFREPDRRAENLRSRGELPVRFLAEPLTSEDYIQFLHDNAHRYAGFNLLFGDRHTMFYCSNRDGGAIALPEGVHALSNHLLNTPWPKVRRLQSRFSEEVRREQPRIDALLEMLADPAPAEAYELPETGLSREWEQRLSATKIIDPVYGTRASTIVLVDVNGEVVFHERRFQPDGETEQDTWKRFDVSNASGNMPE